MKFLKSVLAGMLLIPLFMLSAHPQGAAIKKAEVTNKVEIKVTGMTCVGCASHVSMILSETAGVKKHEVKYPGDVAVVTYDPKKTSPEDLVAVIQEKTNYTAEIKKKAADN